MKEEDDQQNPTYAWVNSELAKAKADLGGLEAREVSLTSIVNALSAQAHKLEEQGIQQGDLMRTEKADEANYVLYTKKNEEARIEDAMDRTRTTERFRGAKPDDPEHPDPVPLDLWWWLAAGVGGQPRRGLRA